MAGSDATAAEREQLTAKPYPLLVGVVGHRVVEPEALPVLRAKVAAALAALANDYPALPLTVVSCLAKGADQLVAEEALKLGLGVFALLPVPADRLEFGDPEARATALAILADRRTRVIDLTAFGALQQRLREAAAGDAARLAELAYEQAGLLLVRHSHLLLALVEQVELEGLDQGKTAEARPSAPVGGSRRVLSFWLNGRLEGGAIGLSPLVPEESLLHPVLTGPLLHLETPRLGKPSSAAAGTLRLVLPRRMVGAHPRSERLAAFFGCGGRFLAMLGETPAWPRRHWHLLPGGHGDGKELREGVLERLQNYARLTAAEIRRTPAALAAAWHSLLPVTAPELEQPSARALQGLFATPDAMANVLQKRVRRLDGWILAAVPLSVMLLEVFVKFLSASWMLALYIAVFLAAVAAYRRFRRQGLQDWYQDCRFLGEAARVQFYWGLAGLPRSVADAHLRHELGESSWLYAAAKATSLYGLDLAQARPARRLVFENWLGGPLSRPEDAVPRYSYRRWYLESAERYERRHHGLGLWRKLCFAGGYVVAAVTTILYLCTEAGWLAATPGIELTKKIMVVFIPVIPATGAVLGLWRERRTYEAQAQEYRRMDHLVREALAVCEEAEMQERAAVQDRLYTAVGEEALSEAARWLIAHRNQPIHPVPAG